MAREWMPHQAVIADQHADKHLTAAIESGISAIEDYVHRLINEQPAETGDGNAERERKFITPATAGKH